MCSCFCLKKIATILLMSLLAFNWFGYKLVINYLQNKADRQLESRIDINDYNESQLIEIRVALDMPYQTDRPDFERHYGEISINGKIYTYVKRKVVDGYLILKCLPNTAKQNIKNADDRMFKANNGLDQEHNGKNDAPLNKINKNIFSVYDDYSYGYPIDPLCAATKQFLFSELSSFHSVHLPVAEQPPETI